MKPRSPVAVSSPSSTDSVFARFVQWEAAGSVVLLAASVASLAWANSPWSDGYFYLSHIPIGLHAVGLTFTLSLQHWVNDLLMAVFFFVVGLEIKRELVVGQLSTRRKAALPVLAALGGMLVPAGIYALINAGGPGAHGWGVPMATDIAFALGVLTAFGDRIPAVLKVFLAALAIADDLGAVVVIAVFYTETIRVAGLAAAAVVLGLFLAAARAGVSRIGVYVLLWLLLWAAVTASHLHSTVAGVLAAFTVPVRADGDIEAMGPKLERYLHPVVAFLIVPIFGFFNAGVAVDPTTVRNLMQPVGAGIVLGLVFGKQIGIMAFTWIGVASRGAALPAGITWKQIYGVAALAGVGFTMSLFVTDLAFASDTLAAAAKVAILLSSVVAAAWGASVISLTLRRTT